MIQDWLSLSKYPIVVPGMSLKRLRLQFLWLALRYPNNNLSITSIQSIESDGEVWNNFNKWLRFQTRYVHKKKWANSPVIRAVTLVHTSKFDEQDLSKISPEIFSQIDDAISKYLNVFNGMDERNLKNWFIRNYLLTEAFSNLGYSPIIDSGSLLEIGPGLGGVLSLSMLQNHRNLYSFDTIEMQEIYRALDEKFLFEQSRLKLVPVNTTTGKFHLANESAIENIVAFWSFTELKESDRDRYTELFSKAENILIASNEHFEGINNFDYLEDLATQLQMSVSVKNLGEVFSTSLPGYQYNHRVYLLRKTKI